MYVSKTPFIFKQVRKKQLLWELPPQPKGSAPCIYLSFDDGPIPEVTPKVLDILESYNAKASFFMVGDNVQKYPELYELVKEKGHLIGNHSFHHLNGWKTEVQEYSDDIEKANQFLKTSYLRPPYGRIRLSQIRALSSDYKIIMWSVLSADYDLNVSRDECFQNVIKHTKDGSIIVFHDSLKAKENMLYALPKVLEYFSEKGYVFKSIYDTSSK